MGVDPSTEFIPTYPTPNFSSSFAPHMRKLATFIGVGATRCSGHSRDLKKDKINTSRNPDNDPVRVDQE